ncbi:MAG: response regulator [Rhodomicrobiaceae bacterium]
MITAQNEAPADFPVSSKRVLVAEDSPVTQDLLKLILMQRGHKVDIADDGEQALAALDRTPYDVALIDFRLPKLNGLGVAQQYRSQRNGDPRARLIAITADVEGLLAHKENCENFDQIIPKPLDIYEVCKVIERSTPPGEGNGSLAGDVEGPGGIEAGSPGVAARAVGALQGARRPEPPWATGLELLRWPDDIPVSGASGSAVPEFQNLDSIDAILIRTPASVADLGELWSRRPLHLFPVIDLDGSLRGYSDYDASKGARRTVKRSAGSSRDFISAGRSCIAIWLRRRMSAKNCLDACSSRMRPSRPHMTRMSARLFITTPCCRARM